MVISASFPISDSIFLVSQHCRINLTPSTPYGIYVIEKKGNFRRGDIVAFCLPLHDQLLGLQRRYLLPGTRCHGSAALLKTVLAVPGDTVLLSNKTISINGKTYAYATYRYDNDHRPLTIYPRGIYKATNGYWLIGTHDAKSWDPRYWEPVDRAQLLFVVQPWLVFN